MSYKTEVLADSSGKWAGNGLRFATEQEAKDYVADLYSRWTAVRETRVVESDDPVSHEWRGGRDGVYLQALPVKQADLEQPDARLQGVAPKFDS
jgi:hypothetical protein